MTDNPMIEQRIQRIEDTLAIQQLPIRYAMAIDERDIDTWVDLFVPDVQVGRESVGRDALRGAIVSMTRAFYRSMHQIVGHRIELTDSDRAVGNVYCRAEHEVGERWVVMAIRYDDEYRKLDGRWYFQRRRERHWYAADQLERPQQVAFSSWDMAGPPNLPRSSTWSDFWSDVDAAQVTSAPVQIGTKE
ncbi:nuclear transport factor 2 family protein [Mycobacterium sp.]|uniref:nuclear transport factor 2 family protein n=1 Tax=Mycobacterium sp. TaxID=1785 RepID=UPI0025E63803|nr:nuclear transport factor 2 family protein [Mycobacterium sp.]